MTRSSSGQGAARDQRFAVPDISVVVEIGQRKHCISIAEAEEIIGSEDRNVFQSSRVFQDGDDNRGGRRILRCAQIAHELPKVAAQLRHAFGERRLSLCGSSTEQGHALLERAGCGSIYQLGHSPLKIENLSAVRRGLDYEMVFDRPAGACAGVDGGKQEGAVHGCTLNLQPIGPILKCDHAFVAQRCSLVRRAHLSNGEYRGRHGGDAGRKGLPLDIRSVNRSDTHDGQTDRPTDSDQQGGFNAVSRSHFPSPKRLRHNLARTLPIREAQL